MLRTNSWAQYQDYLVRFASEVKEPQLVDMASRISKCFSSNGTLFLAGNGGSASTIEHFCTDLLSIRSEKLTKNSLSNVYALSLNGSTLTAIGNDIGFDNLFKLQLERFAKPNSNDLFFVISVSGASVNLITAAKWAKENGIYTLGLIGVGNSELKKLLNLEITLNAETGIYGPCEDVHLAICHRISEILHGFAF